MPPPPDLTLLLRQASWTRALARSLAHDVHLADDLVQDAWVAALERPPDLARPVRGWLARVVRRRWLDLGRARARRAERERLVAVEDAWPSPLDVVARAALQRELVEAVLALDEPYRTTVLLRFFEDLPQREIARRTGTTAATVNSRLTRALARLRGSLASGRGRAAWLHVLVPLLREPAAAPALVLGAGAMKLVSSSLVVAASLVAGFVLWNTAREEPRGAGSAPPARTPTAAELARPARASSDVAALPALREPDATRAERAPGLEPAPPPAPLRPPRVLRGRVLDAYGVPLAGIALARSADATEVACTSGSGGWFELALAAPAEAIVCADPHYATVMAGSAEVHTSTEPLVVVAPRIHLAGAVVDPVRAPLGGAALELLLPAGFGAEWSVPLDHSLRQSWRARSGADGRFELAGVPAVDGAVLHATLAGFAPLQVEAPRSSVATLELVLVPPGAGAGLVRGVVLDEGGARVADAHVSAGADIARTGTSGEFTLDVRCAPAPGRLVALAWGRAPAVFEPGTDAHGALLWPDYVVLRLGGPAGTLSGRVIDADGRPVGGAKVWLDDPTPFGRTADARLVTESLVRGDERFWSFERTAPDGTFELRGLLARAYRLQALDPLTLASVESAPVTAADAPIELRLPTHDVHAKVAGRVVSLAGRPLAGVSVRLFRLTYELAHQDGVDNEAEESAPVVTGADGAFEFRDVPRSGVDLVATGDTILGAGAALAEEPEPARIELVASLRLHLQVELDEPRDRRRDWANRLCVLDADGAPLPLRVFRGRGAHASFDMPVRAGRSEVLAVPEGAATLVLYLDAEEVTRMALQLVAGRTNVIRPR